MKHFSAIIAFILLVSDVCWAKECVNRKTTSKLVCYYSKLTQIDNHCECTHVILPPNAELKEIEAFKENYDRNVKILITVNEFNQGLINILNRTKVDGLEINLKKLDSKSDISDFITTVKQKFAKDLLIFLSVPAKTEVLAKYYDFKALSKHTDHFIVQTAFLGASKNVTFHPSPLSGLWDVQNTDSVVDLVTGLGAPLHKLIITAPVQAFHFKLQSDEYTAPGSPALELRSLTRNELCTKMNEAGRNWTLERDQDQAGAYIFSQDDWIAFEDVTSIDIKAKYTRVRGLAGMALKDVSQDGGENCGPSVLQAAYTGLSRQARAPRGAVLHSLEREILQPQARPVDSVQLSPYRISRVVDVEGHVHVIRKDTRTEFECSRQGYFVHPRSCNRFYRCVKFDQLTDEFNVFEFDCPAGLVFDERVEVCVWPGSLPHASACAGSSEIEPVPKNRFVCPGEPGYYADPENCRWFFACMDHGKSPLTAYEFRCPFGLLFDQARLVCEWPWLVPTCASGEGYGIALATETLYGGAGLLAQYDGLGALGTVALGGLSGTIQQPIERTYSNVGHVGYAFTNGLSYKAVDSLQNAGLLKAGYDISGADVSGYASNEAGAYDATLVNGGYDLSAGSGVGTAGNVNIVGGGYSAVGVKSAGVQISNSGLGIASVTPSPIAVSTASSIPLVSTVAVPAIKTASSFNTGLYNGGVVANVPELQYRVEQPSVAISQAGINIKQSSEEGYLYQKPALSFSEGISGYSVSSTPKPFAVVPPVGGASLNYLKQEQNQGYLYEKPSIAFEEGISVSSTVRPLTVVQETVQKSEGYVYERPSVTFEETPLKPILPVAANSYNYHQQSTLHSGEGYVYQKPSIAFQEVPARAVTPAVSVSAYGGVSTVRPVVSVASKLTPLVQETYVKPISTLNGYSYQDEIKSNTYYYPRPAVVQQPSYVGTYQQPATTGYSYQGVLQQAISKGYSYPKPQIAFEETPITYSTPKPSVVVQQPQVYVQQTPVVSSYNYVSPSTTVKPAIVQGYAYPKPQIAFEEVPVVVPTPKPAVVSSYNYLPPKPAVVGYEYPKPQVVFEERPKPLVVSSYNYVTPSSTPTPAVLYQQTPVKPVVSTYNYVTPKPAVFVQQPQVVVEQTPVKPVVSTYNYVTPKSAVLVQQPQQVYVQQTPVKPAIVESYNYITPSTTPRPSVVVEQQAYAYPKPQIAFEEVPKPAVVSTYNYLPPQTSPKPAVVGYAYPKPQLSFEEVPIVTPKPAVVSTYNYVTPKPAVVVQQPQVYVQQTPIKPAIVESYNYVAPSTTSRPAIVQGYAYPKPQVTFEEVAKPVVSTYNYLPPQTSPKPAVVGYDYPKPQLAFEEVPIVTPKPVVSTYNYVTPAPVKKVVQPAISTYTYQNIAQEAISNRGYAYPRPQVAFEERPVVSTYNYVTPSTTVKPVVVQQPAISSYNYVAPTVKPEIYVQRQPEVVVPIPTTPRPQTFVSYQKPAIVQEEKTVQYTNYNYVKPAVTYEQQYPVQEVPFVKKTAYVTGQISQPAVVEQKTVQYSGYNYPKPSVAFEERPVPVQEVPFVKKTAYTTGQVSQPVYVENYQAPIATYKETVNTKSYYQEYAVPQVKVIPQSTPRPTYVSTVASVIKPQTEDGFYYYDSRYDAAPVLPTTERAYVIPRVTKPARVYLPTTPAPRVTYSTAVPVIKTVTTSRPIVDYSFSSLDDREYLPPSPKPVVTTTPAVFVVPEVTKPSRAYLPTRNRVRVQTSTLAPSTSYLPVVEEIVSTRRPVKVVKVVRPKVQKIVKVNDYHPMLSMKLGAQCTCASNTVKLRKRPLKIVVEEEEDDSEYDDDDGYAVLPNSDEAVIVEDYKYEPQRVVEITPAPEVILQSTTRLPVVRKRVKVIRPQPTSQLNEVFLKSTTETAVSDHEIVKAVRTGLKLVKQAAKEGAKEGTKEALSGQLDRVGPGGWRGRDETLQGTIDCQRPGLFRHPKQCNKFYACRWDCTKNRYTLHVFNCPVHLTFDNNLGACNWPSQGPACLENTLLPSD